MAGYLKFRLTGYLLELHGIAITPCITGASFTNVLVNAVVGCNYRIRGCALYIQLNRKRTPTIAKGPEMDK